MFGLYTFMDWNDNPRTMRASTIHKIVMEESKKSNYGWIASATDLIYVCEKKGFPSEYATNIKAAILNCFSALIRSEDDTRREKKTDILAVYYAFNSLFGIENETAINARSNFLSSFLNKIRWNPYLYMVHPGKTYKHISDKWYQDKYDLLINKPNINFKDMEVYLTNNWENVFKSAEENGLFTEDDKIEKERQHRIFNYHLNPVDDWEEYFWRNNCADSKTKKLTP